MTRVIHTADTHLGYRQYHSSERRRDFLSAFRSVIEDAIEDDVDAVVHAGDLFHSRQPGLADIRGALDVLRDLREADIPFLAVVGNHERTRDEQWLDLFESLDLATRLGREPVAVGDVDFYGLDFVPRSKRDRLDYAFEPGDRPFAALVAHGLFTPFPHADWETETVLAESTVEFDAVLLGDNHTPDRAEVDGTWVTYAGSTERADASEREERGYNIVSFDDGVAISRRGIDTRPFVTVDLTLEEGEGLDRVRERVGEEDLEDAVVIVTIEGEGEAVPAARVEEFAAERGALVARVNDRREFEDEDVAEVRFADPDDAVRGRLREFGPSEAALALDGTIRADDVPDSNVRERVRDRVEDLLDDDPAAFTSTGEVEAAPSGDGTSGTEAEAEGTDDPESEDGEGDEDEDAGDGQVTMEDYL